MKLRKLIANLPIEIYRGNQDAEITGVCTHSKLVAPGNLFIAKKGFTEDGSKYMEEAIAAGAAAVLSDMPNPFLKGVVQLLSQNSAAVEGELSARFYDYPSESLYMIGITGTKGKTTITYLIKHLFDMLGMPCGLIGTIEYLIGQHHLEVQTKNS
jgi:UDP-N-acetylmuramoyl-L-alanyl-D-glutamate--2,6-diaminopimelate ligase